MLDCRWGIGAKGATCETGMGIKCEASVRGAEGRLFFKQWGGWGADGKKRAKKQNGRLLEGRTWDAVPVRYAEQGAALLSRREF